MVIQEPLLSQSCLSQEEEEMTMLGMMSESSQATGTIRNELH